MIFNTQVCTTIEQSERLLALGLKKETTDMTLVSFDDTTIMELIGQTSVSRATIKINGTEVQTEDLRHIPAWSLHRLIAMIPKWCKKEYYFHISGREVHYRLNGTTEYGISHYSFWEKENLYGNIIDCIEWLIKENHFNKQYLNES